ncbi:hypothetical protein ABZ307_39685 [Streptomyces griseorubiginosus]|uniref:hypothetical protein n=1 Tax=Streptomyces griseorubiginosus TaxID=67304 RepID=UPI0033A25D95
MIDDTAVRLTAAGLQLAPAGVEWDVVKVERHLGVRAIEQIAELGAVAVDPSRREPMLYFFVPKGTAAHWDVPKTSALGRESYVVLPPARKEEPPGPYWLVPLQRGLTSAGDLQQALESVQ